jgi:hypothetical protein
MFLAELDANTLLLHHIHFTLRRGHKYDCTINSLTTESNCHPLLWYVASGDVVSYMVVTSIIDFVPDIFDQTSYVMIKLVYHWILCRKFILKLPV